MEINEETRIIEELLKAKKEIAKAAQAQAYEMYDSEDADAVADELYSETQRYIDSCTISAGAVSHVLIQMYRAAMDRVDWKYLAKKLGERP